jgi:hypothetical protein
VLAWQVQGPEFGPQHRKKKKKKGKNRKNILSTFEKRQNKKPHSKL